ncbi:MAG: Flp pilus assembly complex ATPase component TadA [Planctomycetes bacterium]|nr:Flp pilus assembly complex ATPase component TadA [Planctomycetota bacterium]
MGTGPRQVLVARLPFTIGRDGENDLVLSEKSVSKHHCRLLLENGHLAVEDLESRSGTSVNHRRIEQKTLLKPGDTLQLGGVQIEVRAGGNEAEVGSDAPSPRETTAARPAAESLQPARGGDSRQRWLESIRKHPDLARIDFAPFGGESLRQAARDALRSILETEIGEFPEDDAFLFGLLNEALGYGPIHELLLDPTIDEIMINGHDAVFIEREGKVLATGAAFRSPAHLLNVLQRILAMAGRTLDEKRPMVDASLPDGSRVNAVLPPLSASGPLVTIRKFAPRGFTIQDLVRMGTLSRDMASFLKTAMECRRNILVSGGTGSGKSTLLKVLSSFIRPEERVITIEDAVELHLALPHVLQLEARPPLPGERPVTVRELLINSLRMRPDRILIGECRGGEALDMLQAMNTGHDGSLTTLHANSPRDALHRLETLVLMAGIELPAQAVRRQIASAIHLIIQQSRFSDGSRKVVAITELTGLEGEIYTLQEIFRYESKGAGGHGRVVGEHAAQGAIPKFILDLRARNVEVDLSLYQDAPPARTRGPDRNK